MRTRFRFVVVSKPYDIWLGSGNEYGFRRWLHNIRVDPDGKDNYRRLGSLAGDRSDMPHVEFGPKMYMFYKDMNHDLTSSAEYSSGY